MATTAGLVAATLITACVVPQVVAVIHSPDPAGVSSTAAGQASLSCAAWTAYALSTEMTIAAWSSGSGAVLWGVVAIVAAVRSGSRPSPVAATCSLLVVVLASTAGPAALGTLLLTEALATTVPQASRARTQVGGLAMSTYLMMCAGASCWVIYGAGTGDWPLSASSLLKATVCAYIVLLVRIKHRRRRRSFVSTDGTKTPVTTKHPALRTAVAEQFSVPHVGEEWNAPGVYILRGPVAADGSYDAYVGKAALQGPQQHLTGPDHRRSSGPGRSSLCETPPTASTRLRRDGSRAACGECSRTPPASRRRRRGSHLLPVLSSLPADRPTHHANPTMDDRTIPS